MLAAALASFVVAAVAVEINTANQAQLETVKGIGPGMSGRILDERQKGAFKDWADLTRRVRGVGANTASRWSADGLTVGGVPYRASSAPSP